LVGGVLAGGSKAPDVPLAARAAQHGGRGRGGAGRPAGGGAVQRAPAAAAEVVAAAEARARGPLRHRRVRRRRAAAAAGPQGLVPLQPGGGLRATGVTHGSVTSPR